MKFTLCPGIGQGHAAAFSLDPAWYAAMAVVGPALTQEHVVLVAAPVQTTGHWQGHWLRR